MHELAIVYLSGFVVSFIIGLWWTFSDSESYKDLIKGLFFTALFSLFSWLFTFIAIMMTAQGFADKHLNKKLPWKKNIKQ